MANPIQKKILKIKKLVYYEKTSQTRVCPNCDGIMMPHKGIYKCIECKYKEKNG